MSFVEGDAKWWDDAAQNLKELATELDPAEKAKCQVLVAVYDERAKTHRELANKIRQRLGA